MKRFPVDFLTRHPMVLAAFLLAVAVALPGCSTPSATERFYALGDGVPSTAAEATASNAWPGIVIGAVTVPELVDRPQIVTRDGANRVNVAEQQLWAEPVKSGIARVLAARLARSLADAGRPARVAAYPQTTIANPDVRITIDVQRFDAVPGGDAVIDALWSVRRLGDGSVRSGHTVATRPISGTGYDETVRAWSDALDALNRDLVAAIGQVDLTQPSTSSKTR